MLADFLVPDIGVYNDEDESGGEEIDGEGSEQEIDGMLVIFCLISNEN